MFLSSPPETPSFTQPTGKESVRLWTMWNMCFEGAGQEGLLHRMRNSRRVFHDVRLNWGVRLLHKDLDLPICPDMFQCPM
jgi:hypothetical protein